MPQHQPFDFQAYSCDIQTRPCFICQMVAGKPAYAHEIIYEDERAIVFLNKYPPLYGYVLIAPRDHREQVTGDFTLDEYLALQQIIYRVAEAVRRVVSPERVYVLSLGSQQGNKHVHWHVAPLPPGVPFEQQQLAALSLKHGFLQLSAEETSALASQLRAALAV
ncbi:ATP adenylyltransferase [Thermoflexales bacterium]|nr:ATP adenylyltransferase [Thermoflexales bacterium]